MASSSWMWTLVEFVIGHFVTSRVQGKFPFVLPAGFVSLVTPVVDARSPSHWRPHQTVPATVGSAKAACMSVTREVNVASKSNVTLSGAERTGRRPPVAALSPLPAFQPTRS